MDPVLYLTREARKFDDCSKCFCVMNETFGTRENNAARLDPGTAGAAEIPPGTRHLLPVFLHRSSGIRFLLSTKRAMEMAQCRIHFERSVESMFTQVV